MLESLHAFAKSVLVQFNAGARPTAFAVVVSEFCAAVAAGKWSPRAGQLYVSGRRGGKWIIIASCGFSRAVT
ncbi:hypothetical protein BJX65DRAFT_131983 [Aspergillus insuetus]